jgi:mannosyltransferase
MASSGLGGRAREPVSTRGAKPPQGDRATVSSVRVERFLLAPAALRLARADRATLGGPAIDRALMLGLAATALALDLFRLPGTSLWADELVSAELASQSWPVFWQFITQQEPHMALYYLLLHVWLIVMGAFGINADELAVRAPSFFFAILGVAMVFAIGRRFGGRIVGVVAAALYLLNFIQLTKAREARSYSLETFLVCVGWYALLVAIGESDRRRWWIVYPVVMILGMYAHPLAALILASQVVAFIGLLILPTEWRDRARRSIRSMVISVGLICVALLPMALFFVRHGSTNAWLPPAGAAAVLRAVWNVAGHDVVYALLLGGAAIAAMAVTARAIGGPRPSQNIAPAIALTCWLCVPIAISYALTQPVLNLHLFSWTYLLMVVPALCLLAATTVAGVRAPRRRLAAAVALIVAASVATPLYSFPPTQDFRTAMQWVADRWESGDGLVSTTWSATLATGYYTRIGVLPSAVSVGSPAGWDWPAPRERPLDESAVAGYAAAHSRVFLLSALLMGDTANTVQEVTTFEGMFDRAYHLVDQIVVESKDGSLTVRLYETSRRGESP